MPKPFKPLLLFVACVLCGGLLLAAAPELAPLPSPTSAAAVTGVKSGRFLIFSLMGIGAKKTWDAVTNAAYVLDTDSGKWSQMRPVPGTAGRIDAVAVGARGYLYLFGGFVLDAQGAGLTVSDANVYDPESDRWLRAEDVPVPVANTVVGAYRDRYIYLVGGFSRTDAVNAVQVFDIQKNVWKQATPLPGTPVFGHAGGLVKDTLIYVDGVHRNASASGPRIAISDECWMGKIDHGDPAKIQWTKLPNHPGPARYRIAAGASEKDGKIYFSGGSERAYNYKGIGYDGKPAEPSAAGFAYNVHSGKWEIIPDNPNPTMDQGGLAVTSRGLVLAGGMDKSQNVINKVTVLPKHAKTE